MPLTDQAIKLLIERGFPMLPSTGARKGPCVKWKEYQKKLPTADQIREWGRNFDPVRWGLVTGALAGIVVADFDGDEGIAMMRDWGINPHVRTGSGGYHWYLQHPGWRVPTLNAKTSKRSWPWKGLDIRGDGGFAVLLGRNNNGPYEQLRELVPDGFDALPEEVRSFLRNNGVNEEPPPKKPRPAQQPAPSDGRSGEVERLIHDALEMAPNGRNDAGFWLACQLRDNSWCRRDAEAAVRSYQSRVPSTNAKAQREPYTVREALASLREAYARAAREPWKQKNSGPQEKKASADATSMQLDRPDCDTPAAETEPRTVSFADGPESISLYVDHTGDPLLDHTGDPLHRFRFTRIPWEVLMDSALADLDIRVYGVIAGGAYQGSTSKVGTRRIAECIHASRRLVVESIHRLEKQGHLRICTQKRGHRGYYFLTSDVFSQKQRADVQEIISGPRPRIATARKDQGAAWSSGSGIRKNSDQAKSSK